MQNKNKIAIVGAGISGLCCAYWLNKNGFDVTVFEKSGHLGGSIITEKNDGFLVDLGPNSALETSDTLKELINEIGLHDEKIYANAQSSKRYIVKNGSLHAVPMSPMQFIKTPLFSAGAKLRLFKEPFIKPTNGADISLAEFVRYRLGKEFLDYAINPFVAGVYAGDPENLSTKAAFPKLHALEQNYGSFIKGAIKGKKERKKRGEVAKDRAKLFSFKSGMQTFPDMLAEKLKDKIYTQCEITKLEKSDDGFRISFIKDNQKSSDLFGQVILSTPATALSAMLNDLMPMEAAKISKINYPPVTVVFTGFKETAVSRSLDGFGFLVPQKEQMNILGSIWSSTIFPGRAPQGYVAFTTFVGGTRQPEVTGQKDDALLKTVLEDLGKMTGISEAPVFVKMKRWARAIPQYTLGYPEIMNMFANLEESIVGLYVAGNLRRGVGLGDSVLSAHETVEKIISKN